MKEEARLSRDGRDAIAKALDALEAAREMPRGPERTQALKEAGRLRHIADLQGGGRQAQRATAENSPEF